MARRTVASWSLLCEEQRWAAVRCVPLRGPSSWALLARCPSACSSQSFSWFCPLQCACLGLQAVPQDPDTGIQAPQVVALLDVNAPGAGVGQAARHLVC
jgi:hypothetical protein